MQDRIKCLLTMGELEFSRHVAHAPASSYLLRSLEIFLWNNYCSLRSCRSFNRHWCVWLYHPCSWISFSLQIPIETTSFIEIKSVDKLGMTNGCRFDMVRAQSKTCTIHTQHVPTIRDTTSSFVCRHLTFVSNVVQLMVNGGIQAFMAHSPSGTSANSLYSHRLE